MPPVNRQSLFSQWSKLREVRNGTCITHLILSGGILRLNPECEEQLLKMVTADLKAGNPNYIVECRTPYFAFCQDFDFETKEGVSLEKFLLYMDKVIELLGELCISPGRHVVCSAADKTLANGNIKSGYHVIYPDMIVDAQTAVRIRFCLLQQFDILYQGDTINMWSDVLDMTIYMANGLRMVGSHKATRCRSCTAPCPDCHGTKYLDQGRPYRVVAVDGEPIGEERLSAHDEVRMTTIRRFGATEEQCVKFDMPGWFDSTLFDYNRAMAKLQGVRIPRKRSKEDGRTGNAHAGELVRMTLNNRTVTAYVVTPETDKATRILVEWIKTTVPTPPGGTGWHFRRIIRTGGKGSPRFWLITSNHYCPNKGGQHGRNDTYLAVNAMHVVPRCWSQSAGTGQRKHGACNSKEANDFFWSLRTLIPKSVRKAIADANRAEPVDGNSPAQ